MAKPNITEAEFAVLAARAGLRLDAGKLAELHAAYGLIEAMAARLREPHVMDAEPALIFVAAAGTP